MMRFFEGRNSPIFSHVFEIFEFRSEATATIHFQTQHVRCSESVISSRQVVDCTAAKRIAHDKFSPRRFDHAATASS